MKSEVVYNVGDPAQVERLIRELWRRHVSPESDLKTWMGESDFGDAVAWLLDAFDSGHVVNLRSGADDHCVCWLEGEACCRCGWELDDFGLGCEGDGSCAHK